jgi:phospholipid/cholesterol/gamma-HCH transport system substrate-binding protein
MKNKSIDNTKVGMLVFIGFLFMIFTLYMIGKNRNIFGSTFAITARLSNVNGLVAGNNVRFKGINVGTVKSIIVDSDSTISVQLIIEKKMKPFIRKNSVATIGTDGLMGDKVVNINSSSNRATLIEEGDTIQSRMPVETDDMLRTLNVTNNNIERITANLSEMTQRLNQNKNLWALLSDSSISDNIRKTMFNIHQAGVNAVAITASLKSLGNQLSSGKGLANRLFADTTLSNQLASSIHELEQITKETSGMMSDLKNLSEGIKKGKGAAGLLLADTTLRNNLKQSAVNIEQGTAQFNQNMEALKSNFLFKHYFKKKEKEMGNDLPLQKPVNEKSSIP